MEVDGVDSGKELPADGLIKSSSDMESRPISCIK